MAVNQGKVRDIRQMKRTVCVFQDGLILGIWKCEDGRFYYHLVETDEQSLTEEKMWEELDYALAFNKGEGSVDEFFGMAMNMVKPEDWHKLQEWMESKERN